MEALPIGSSLVKHQRQFHGLEREMENGSKCIQSFIVFDVNYQCE